MSEVKGWLATVPYRPPEHPALVKLDVVTPTRNRPSEIKAQAAALAKQLTPRDRWLVVDDASNMPVPNVDVWRLATAGGADLMFVQLCYFRGENAKGTVNRARHAGCSLARPDSWIVELDDHDELLDGALDAIREAICLGATLVYGDVLRQAEGAPPQLAEKPNYVPFLLRDGCCPCEGVRAFPKFLYDAVGGYRWEGEFAVGQNEFPAGDYGLFMRIEQLCEGQGFVRVPKVLCRVLHVAGSISTRFAGQQAEMADRLRRAARDGKLM